MTYRSSRWIVLILAAMSAMHPQSLSAQKRMHDSAVWTFDPQLLLQHSPVVIERAPDADLERLYQAVATAANQPDELRAMCALFDPQARRDLAAINTIALGLSTASQRRFQDATDRLLQVSADAPRQPYDADIAHRSLRQSAVVASMLFDGFLAGLNTQGSDPASQRARCRSLHQLLHAVGMRPLAERAMIMRLLLREGVSRVDPDGGRRPYGAKRSDPAF